MAKKPVTTGKALERQVADAYRAIGARRVEHDVELAGEESTPIGRSDMEPVGRSVGFERGRR